MATAKYEENYGNYVIKDGLISSYMFDSCSSMINATISNVPSIEENAFQNTNNLRNVIILNGLSHISNNAFINSGIKSIQIYGSVVSVGIKSFYNCTNLEEFKLTDSIKNILYKHI